jgi:hypothetical protein
MVATIAKGILALGIVISMLGSFGSGQHTARAEANHQEEYCTAPHMDVAIPLTDLGGDVYVRMDGQNTGEIGGLYPGGSNVRPPEHEADGVAMASQIVPLDANGNPDPVNGKIVLVSIGMSNTHREFTTFMEQVDADPDINTHLVLVNGAQGGRVAVYWIDPDAEAWQYVYQVLSDQGLTPAQVQVAWVKQTSIDTGDFPEWSMELQGYLEMISRNLKTNFPNIKIAYYSSRARSYKYWIGQNPEPSAYESGFSVRWMIEKQINGDPSLNFDPNNGEVVAPYLSWGPYLWIDGENPRSDGQVWPSEDLIEDCTHPSLSGRMKVTGMLMDFFKTDTTTVGWFLGNPPTEPTSTPTSTTTAISTSTATATPTSTSTPTPRVTVGPPPTESTATNTATVLEPTPRAYIPVVFRDGISQGFARTSLFSFLMLAAIGMVLAIKLGARK